jgi:hypothetical protein
MHARFWRASTVSVHLLRAGRLALVALDTTTGVPALVTECAVLHMDAGAVSAGPWSYWVQPDVSWRDVRRESVPNVRLAPPWSAVAERVVEAIGRRVLVVHERGSYAVLRAHLPDWAASRVVFTREVAEHVWPDLDSYDITERAGAAAQLYALNVLVSALVTGSALPLSQRRGGGLTRHA